MRTVLRDAFSRMRSAVAVKSSDVSVYCTRVDADETAWRAPGDR